MTEFQKYILKNHPDPDSLLVIGDKFEEMCRLATGFSEQQVKNNEHNVRRSCFHDVWKKWCESNSNKNLINGCMINYMGNVLG